MREKGKEHAQNTVAELTQRLEARERALRKTRRLPGLSVKRLEEKLAGVQRERDALGRRRGCTRKAELSLLQLQKFRKS